jgi:hypothetical protein
MGAIRMNCSGQQFPVSLIRQIQAVDRPNRRAKSWFRSCCFRGYPLIRLLSTDPSKAVAVGVIPMRPATIRCRARAGQVQ